MRPWDDPWSLKLLRVYYNNDGRRETQALNPPMVFAFVVAFKGTCDHCSYGVASKVHSATGKCLYDDTSYTSIALDAINKVFERDDVQYAHLIKWYELDYPEECFTGTALP